MKRISSRQNPLVARCRTIAKGDERALILLDGPHLVAEAIAAGLKIHHVFVCADDLERGDIKPIVEQLDRKGLELVTATRPVMAAMSPVRSSSAVVAIVARPSMSEERLYSAAQPLVVVACDVQDPGNIGAIARVAEAAGATGMIACGESADPFGWKALRGSMGSALRLPIAVKSGIVDTIADARRRGCRIVATSPRDGQAMYEADLRGPLALLVGSEGAGLPPSVIDHADVWLTIPMRPPVESLNTAVTAALILYEALRQRG